MKVPILLLPGLGADSTLFVEQKKYFGEQLITPDWIAPQKNESLGEFCQRFADHLLSSELAQCNEAFLGGFSFGGMAALEVAHILATQNRFKIRGVFLISAGRTRKILKNAFKFQASVASKLPDWILKWVLKNQMLGKFLREESLSHEQKAYLSKMVEHLDLKFFKWSLVACANWDPKDKFLLSERGFPVFEIQGEQDKIIPASTEDGVVTLKGAKHLIQYTHAKEINQWLEKITQSG